MFSVIIPLYNKSPYIEKAIQSVISQTFQEFELIVIDDGSTDDSLNNAQFIIHNAELQDQKLSEKIKLISQQNKGVSSTRNNGIKLAKYDYIAFLDADDWWAPTYLEEMKHVIEQYPGAGIYGSSYFKVKNGQHIPARIGVEPGFEKGLINYFQVYAKTQWMPLWTGAVIIKKSIFNSLAGFKPTLKLGEDFDLWVRIALKYPVAFLNRPLAFYNQDVEMEQRGVVDEKIYHPNTHYIFQLDYLELEEKKNADLKFLLDQLRVYTLFRYRLRNAFPKELRKEIDKIDFSKQPIKEKLNYKLPRRLLLLLHRFKMTLFNLIKR